MVAYVLTVYVVFLCCASKMPCSALFSDDEDSTDDDVLVAGIIYLLILVLNINGSIKRRSQWVTPYLRGRREKGRFSTDFADMVVNPHVFQENFHMSYAQFEALHDMIKCHIRPVKGTRPKDFLPTKLKLTITLEFLAKGTMQRELASCYRVSKSAVGNIIESTCKAIVTALQPQYFKHLSTDVWLDTANSFNTKWNVPNCLGAIDGKHIAIRCPHNGKSGSYNYRGFQNMVLMGVADAQYRFQYIDIVAFDSEDDSGVFGASTFGAALLEDRLHIPRPQLVSGQLLNYYFITDDTFPLTRHIMKRYKPTAGRMLSNKQENFNCRISRGRICVENAFGIMCARWCCLAKQLTMKPDRAQWVVNAACTLHNLLMTETPQQYCPPGFGDTISENGDICEGSWRLSTPNDSTYYQHITQQLRGHPVKEAESERRHLMNYFSSPEGCLPWQPFTP